MKVLYRLLIWIYQKQRWLLTYFTPAGLGLLTGIAVTIIIGVDTKQTMAYQVLTFLVAILIVAIIYSFWFRFRFSVKRHLPCFATVGVKFSYGLAIANHTKQTQVGLELLEEISHKPISFVEFKQIKGNSKSFTYIYWQWLKAIAKAKKAKTKAISLPPLQPQTETVLKGEIIPTHRGVVRLGGINILRPDPFNLYRAIREIDLPDSFLVLPKRYQLPTIDLPGSRMSQSGNVSLASSVGDSEEFIGLRDYRPGDPLRKIHWKSWAKTDKPVVKEEESEFFVRHALILDTFQSQAESELLEAAISVAASFACDFQTQESLLDLMFVGLESYCFTSGRGLGNSEQMLEILAGVRACQDKDFTYLTASVMDRLSILSGCICVLMTWDEAREKLIQNLQSFKVPLLILLLAESETDYSQFYQENLYILPLNKLQESLLSIK